MASLTLENVTKRFDDDGDQIVAVDTVSLDIADGEFLVLVGPSGCGKSTTLRMIAGLDTVSEGSIALDGKPITHHPPQQRDVAMVFQSYALYPHMTVRGNMAFGLEESTDMAADEISTTVEETARMLEIDELLDRKPRDLSGGQQQRVALGRAIVRDPQAFLMDEPLSNLDAKLRAEMRTELQRLQNELDVTTVYVTHDQTEAMTMGDRIAILDAGQLQQVATPLECYHRPANLFVAGFIGEPSMNFFTLTYDPNSAVLAGNGFEYPLSPSVHEDIEDLTAVVLGIRPEDVILANDDSESDPGHEFDARVDVVEPMGNENNVYFELGGYSFVGSIPGMRQLQEGSTVRVRLPESAIHLFDAETGEAVHNRSLEELDDVAIEPTGD